MAILSSPQVRKFKMASLFILILLSFASLAKAANSADILINEIAWMGTENSSYDEWIELYNNTNFSINLEDWSLKAVDGELEIKLTGIIPKNDFYLLERTDDNTLPNITADIIYKGALSNDGETLGVYDNLGNLIDSVNCETGWFAGDNSTKQTMERINLGIWQNSLSPSGTPKAKNSFHTIIKVEPQSAPEESFKNITYPSGIVINEILPSPEGADAENEWIEIFNQNNFEVNLSGWQIRDTIGQAKTFTFPEETKISSQEYLIFSRPKTKITLNNSGDGLELIQPDGQIIDRINYGKAPQGESYNLTLAGWFWSSIITPGELNKVPSQAVESLEEDKKPNVEKEGEEDGSEKGLAAISESFKEIQEEPNSNSLINLLIALVIAIFSGTIILILKRPVKTKFDKNL
jgi:hypothetical protein